MIRRLPAVLCCLLLLGGCTLPPRSTSSEPEEASPPELTMPQPELPDYNLPDFPGEETLSLALPAIPPEWGNMTALYYEFGSYSGGICVYQLTPQPNGKLLFEGWGYSGAEGLQSSALVEPWVLDDLYAIFDAFGVAAWDGFSQSDPEAAGGYGFVLIAQFDSGQVLDARGYMRYPLGYDDGHAAIELYLFSVAQSYPLAAGQPVSAGATSLHINTGECI